jgi:hypothetical protein
MFYKQFYPATQFITRLTESVNTLSRHGWTGPHPKDDARQINSSTMDLTKHSKSSQLFNNIKFTILVDSLYHLVSQLLFTKALHERV